MHGTMVPFRRGQPLRQRPHGDRDRTGNTEAIRHLGPWRNLRELKFDTLDRMMN